MNFFLISKWVVLGVVWLQGPTSEALDAAGAAVEDLTSQVNIEFSFFPHFFGSVSVFYGCLQFFTVFHGVLRLFYGCFTVFYGVLRLFTVFYGCLRCLRFLRF